jgi:hypothetical protein
MFESLGQKHFFAFNSGPQDSTNWIFPPGEFKNLDEQGRMCAKQHRKKTLIPASSGGMYNNTTNGGMLNASTTREVRSRLDVPSSNGSVTAGAHPPLDGDRLRGKGNG